MAVVYWDGSTDTDWATAANWTAAATPNADDEVIFDSRQVTKPTTGMTDNGSVDDSGHVNNSTLDLLHFKEGYTGGIGTAALPLCCAPDKIIIEGTGTYHINCAITDQVTSADVDVCIINNPGAIVYLYSNTNKVADGGAAALCEWTKVFLIAGTLHIAYYDADALNAGTYVKDLYISPRHGNTSDATCYIEKDAYDVKNSDVAMNIYMNTGTLITDSMVGTFVMRAGTVYYGSEKKTTTAVTEADMDIAELRQHSGTFYWLPDDTGTPTITLAYIFGGTFTCDDAISNDIAKTITTIHAFTGATLDFKNDKGNITVTSLHNHGARIETDSGSKIGITYNQP